MKNFGDAAAATVVSLFIHLMFDCLAFLEPSSAARWNKALGPFPYGIPQPVYLLLVITAICLPMPYLFFHALQSYRFGKSDAAPRSVSEHLVEHAFPWKAVTRHLRFLFSNSGVPPEIRKSKIVTAILIFYLLGIVVAWIAWSAWRGI